MQLKTIKYLTTLVIALSIAVFQLQAQGNLELLDAESLETLPNAHITFTDQITGEVKMSTSNMDGEVELPFNNETLVEITYIGYQPVTKNISPNRSKTIMLFPYESELETLVITGTSKEMKEDESMATISVIDKSEIEKRGAVNLRDALMNELNINLTQDGVLGTTISMQGMSGENVKVMIDGVPIVGRQSGNIDLSQINLNNVERIEIVEGPLSVIYGTNAIAGVINLITKKNQKDKIEAFVNGYYESTGMYNVDGLVGFKKNNHFIQASGGRYFFDGWNPTAYQRDLQWNPKEQYFGELNYVLRSEKDWFHRFKAAYYQDRIHNRYDPFILNPVPKAFEDWYNTRRNDFTYLVNGRINENFLFNSTNSFNHYKREKKTFLMDLTSMEATVTVDEEGIPINQDTTHNYQLMSRSFFTYDKPGKLYTAQFGYDVTYEAGRGQRFESESGGNTSIADVAGFLAINIKPTQRLSLQPSVRYGYNSRFATIPTPSFALKFDITKNWTYKASYGMGFRAPALKEMYLVFFDSNHKIFGNSDLTPEKSHNVQSSIKYNFQKSLHKGSQKLGMFYNYKYDAIALTAAQGDTFTYVNVSNFSTLGFQWDGSYSYKGLSINTGFSYMGISNRESNANNDLNKFFFSPQVQFNASYRINKWNTNISLFNKYTGARYDYVVVSVDEKDEVEQVKIADYYMMDLSVQQGLWKDRIKLQAGIRNLFDVADIQGTFSSGAHSDGSNTQIGTGRSYFIGIKIGTGK